MEGVEFAVYFFGFWMFLFSPKFRRSWLQQGRSANSIGKAFMFLEAASAIFVGVVLPGALLYVLLVRRS